MKTEAQPIRLVVGGQWGSEAKGAVAAALCQMYDIDYAVRTGGVNAGHTVYYKGQAFKMQQLPTGWVNPKTKLVIGPGAYINDAILEREMAEIEAAMPGGTNARILIDHRAGRHNENDTERSRASGRHTAMGATGKGCSEAVVRRIRDRGDTSDLSKNRTIWGGWDGTSLRGVDTELILNGEYDAGKRILIEGTQGQLLDLLLGPWPYVTHKPTSPAQWLVETGLSPNLKLEIVMVARTMPIRVAGNSGPMPCETDWGTVALMMNKMAAEAGIAPVVFESSLATWTKVSDDVAEKWVMENRLPRYTDTGRPNYNFHFWTAEMRRTYAWAMSEFHNAVLGVIKLDYPKAYTDLMRLFETTTVTKKLRRIALWHPKTMAKSVRQIRPNYIVLTFLNYMFPELWNVEDAAKVRGHEKAIRYVKDKEDELGVKIKFVTTGPKTEHMIEML